MNFQEYQVAIEKFCIYPNIGPYGIVYPILGLIGEIGECFLDAEDVEIVNRRIDLFELGDCYFYIARCLSHLNETFTVPLVERHRTLWSLEQNILMNSHSIAELLKKSIRDSNQDKLRQAVVCLKEIGLDLMQVSYKLGDNPSHIMQMNYDKLNSRLERGVIKGDGDNR